MKFYYKLIPSGALNSWEVDNHPAPSKIVLKYNLKNLQFSHIKHVNVFKQKFTKEEKEMLR